MRKPTGPAKVKDDLTAPPVSKKGISALLFNFDFDDASVKPEHQDWLKRIAAPILTTSPNTQCALKGMASRKGKDTYNDQLSQRRADAVKAFLMKEGVTAGQFSVIGLGETAAALAGRADGTDEEIDRAVAVDITPPTRTKDPFFDGLMPGFGGRGFGRNDKPQWLIIHAAFERRPLRLLHAEGMLVRSNNPAVVRMVSDATNGLVVNDFTAPSNNFIIDFVGGIPGQAVIEVFELNGTLKARLEIDCLPRREIAVACFFVKDKFRKTTRQESTLAAMFDDANRTFKVANIHFTQTPSKPLEFPTQDLGNPMTENTAGINFSTLTSKGDASKRINVYFVWEWQRTSGTGDTDARVDKIGGRHVVFEDSAGVDEGFSMAHEWGHCLGLEHVDEDLVTLKDRLMWPFTDQRGNQLTREEINKANEKAVK